MTNIAIILPILVILISTAFITITSKGTPIPKQFSVKLITPTIRQSPTLSPAVTLIPTQTVLPQNYLTYDKIYTKDQINYFKAHDLFTALAVTKFPPLPKTTTDQLPIYIVDCTTTNDEIGIRLEPKIEWIPRQPDVVFHTLDLMARKSYGQYPTIDEIKNYQSNSQVQFSNQVGGVNQVNLAKNGTLYVNYFDSVQSYGGGSSRLNCMGVTSILTAMQFPSVKSIKQCVDEMPINENSCPYDFQP